MSASSPETPARGPQGHSIDSVASTDSSRLGPLIRHGACGKGWTGLTRGHCSKCHETFTSGAFDKHQHIPDGIVVCSTKGLVAREEPWGTLWTTPGGTEYWNDRRTTLYDDNQL